jgi:uncharacterized delta-60 repeat protein
LRSLALLPDGRLLAGGNLARPIRLRTDGSPDASWNPGAAVTGIVRSAVIQADGKILLGGDFTTVGGQPRRGIARLNADGTPDATFNPGTGVNQNVRSVAVQADRKILIVGEFTTVNGQARNNFARLNSDGTLESTATFNPGIGANGDVRCVAVQADGKILIAGDFTSVNGQPRSRIARLNPDGTLESTATFNATGTNGDIRCIALQADGKILIGGDFKMAGGQVRNGIARLHNSPATSSIPVPAGGTVRWMRGGSSPEISAAVLEVKPATASGWTPLGAGQRMAGGWTWDLSGVSLPASGSFRARGTTPVAHGSGLVESFHQFGPSSPFDAWTLFHNLSGASAAFDADADGDGIVNGLEFALGLDPGQNSTALMPQGTVEGGDFVLRFNQPAGIGGITFRAEASSTMMSGSWIPIPDTGVLPERTFKVPLDSGPSRFLRLRVTMP